MPLIHLGPASIPRARQRRRGTTQWAFPAMTWWSVRCALHEVSGGGKPGGAFPALTWWSLRCASRSRPRHSSSTVAKVLTSISKMSQQADDARVAQRLVDVVLAHRVGARTTPSWTRARRCSAGGSSPRPPACPPGRTPASCRGVTPRKPCAVCARGWLASAMHAQTRSDYSPAPRSCLPCHVTAAEA